MEEAEVTDDQGHENVGQVFAITAGLLLMMTCCGWLIIYIGFSNLSDRLDDVRLEHFDELDDIKNTIREFDSKVETLVDMLRRVELITLAGGEAGRLAEVCGHTARIPWSGSSRQENFDDRRD